MLRIFRLIRILLEVLHLSVCVMSWKCSFEYHYRIYRWGNEHLYTTQNAATITELYRCIYATPSLWKVLILWLTKMIWPPRDDRSFEVTTLTTNIQSLRWRVYVTNYIFIWYFLMSWLHNHDNTKTAFLWQNVGRSIEIIPNNRRDMIAMDFSSMRNCRVAWFLWPIDYQIICCTRHHLERWFLPMSNVPDFGFTSVLAETTKFWSNIWIANYT